MSKNNDKVVYLHKDADGVVRYVGSGAINRAYLTCASSGRSNRYVEFVEANGKLTVEIVAKDLSKLEAEELERELYTKYKETILNHNSPSSTKVMTKEMFEDYFYYDETSKSCVRWKVDRVCGNGGVRIKANSEAGYVSNGNGYYQVGLQGKFYLVHRIVVVLHGFDVDSKVIDHIDRDRSNNKISNLRVVTPRENNQNKSINSNNTSGVQGVKYNKQGYWVTTWHEDGNRKQKYFPIKSYPSSEEAFQAACKYRQQMVELHYN